MSHVIDKLAALLDGELTEAEAARVRSHCAGCATCARALAEHEALVAKLSAARTPPLPAPLWPSVRGRLSRQPAPPHRWGWAGLGAAATAAGLGCGLWLGSLHPQNVESGNASSLLAEGVLLIEGSQQTLDQLYVSLLATDGEGQP